MHITRSERLPTNGGANRVGGSPPPPSSPVTAPIDKGDEGEVRRRNHDISDEPTELLALRSAIDAFVARTGHHHSLILVAQAAEALDELREELVQAELVIAEQQTRIGQLRKLFPDPDANPG